MIDTFSLRVAKQCTRRIAACKNLLHEDMHFLFQEKGTRAAFQEYVFCELARKLQLILFFDIFMAHFMKITFTALSKERRKFPGERRSIFSHEVTKRKCSDF